MRLPTNKYALALTLVLGLQAGAFYTVRSRAETVPAIAPLATFPTSFGEWHTAQEVPMEPGILEVLRADDTLNRVCVNSAGTAAVYLFIAFFKTQRTGQTPHSPKNCLPGGGWEPLESGTQSITVPGLASAVAVNRYIVQRGSEQSVVLYWYQTQHRIIASEASAKFWLVLDAIRYRRSDTALVKVTVPVQKDRVDLAMEAGIQFVQAIFQDLLRHFSYLSPQA